MSDFVISFSRPLYLLALIPALALTLYTYFRLSKRFRRTRNRIISVVLHVLVTVMITCMLAGLTFKYNIKNDGNYILFVVDVSDTTAFSAQDRDAFLENILDDCGEDEYNVGVVTFGFNQIYAAPISSDTDNVYRQYLDAEAPDTSATDIAGALTFAKDIIVDKYDPATSKIVLITDGKETDNSAISIIRSVVSTGIQFNTVYFDGLERDEQGEIIDKGEVQIEYITFPEQHVDVGDSFELKVGLKSRSAVSAKVYLYDNGDLVYPLNDYISSENSSGEPLKNLKAGELEIKLPHSYATQGLHEIECKVEVVLENGDTVVQNNRFIVYQLVESYNKVLILESTDGQSDRLRELLTTDDMFDVAVMNISDSELPNTVDKLREYDQVIMNNVSYADIMNNSKEFLDILYSYVYDYGGNMLTVGGLNETGDLPHIYNKSDMHSTKYEEMLPVDIVDYSPPVAAVIVIDISGSMTTADSSGVSKLDSAKEGARSCVRAALDDKDYIGIITLDTDYSFVLDLTPATDKEKIEEAISSITKPGGGTAFTPAIERAGRALTANLDIEKRHIILVTDGQPSDKEDFPKRMKYFYDNYGITFSILLIDANDTTASDMSLAVRDCGGRCINAESDRLITEMREDIKSTKIPTLQTIEEGFYANISDTESPVLKDVEYLNPNAPIKQLPAKLYGFFGVKAKNDKNTVLKSMYGVPLYSQWRFGKGAVGSFMCDLNGTWSGDLLNDDNGKKLIVNIVRNLMPVESIRPKPLSVTLTEDNYTNRLSITTPLEDGESYKATLQKSGSDEVFDLNAPVGEAMSPEELSESKLYIVSNLKAESAYSNCTFVLKDSGTYKLTVSRVGANGETLSSMEIYKTFSYSAEYDEFMYEGVMLKDSVSDLAERGGGTMVKDNANPYEILDGFLTKLPREYDPRYLFGILSIILFLLDIVVRKFKFKWIHEIVRERKLKKQNEA